MSIGFTDFNNYGYPEQRKKFRRGLEVQKRHMFDVSEYENFKQGNDWAPAIQAAVDDASAAGGGDVFLPNGDYGDLSGVSVPSSVRLVGQSLGVVAVGVELVRNSAHIRLAWGGNSAETEEDRYLKANGVADGGVISNPLDAAGWQYLGREAVLTKLSLLRTSGGGNDEFTVSVYVENGPVSGPTQVASVAASDDNDVFTAELDVTIESGMLLAVGIEGTGTAPGPSFVTLDLEH